MWWFSVLPDDVRPARRHESPRTCIAPQLDGRGVEARARRGRAGAQDRSRREQLRLRLEPLQRRRHDRRPGAGLHGAELQKSYSASTKVTYTKNGVKHVIYYGGRRALADKIAIARQYKLAGIAIWKVGYENQGSWQELPRKTATPRRAPARAAPPAPPRAAPARST